jgi:hypothetical protein
VLPSVVVILYEPATIIIGTDESMHKRKYVQGYFTKIRLRLYWLCNERVLKCLISVHVAELSHYRANYGMGFDLK